MKLVPSLFFLVLFAPAALALPTQETERTYFADATMAREVGFEVRPSCYVGGSQLSGRRTRFVATVRSRCQTSQRSEVSCYVDNRLTSCPANICNSPLFDCH